MFLFPFFANSMKEKTFVESREQKGGWGVEGGRLKWPHHVNYDLKLSKWSSYTNRWRGVIQLVIYVCSVKTGMAVCSPLSPPKLGLRS